ncbi:MAG: MMPL family transporter, partial [Thermoplasmata archaeon]
MRLTPGGATAGVRERAKGWVLLQEDERSAVLSDSSAPESKGRAPGAFSRLGGTVARQHKKVLVVWLILLLASVPLVMRISEAISPGGGDFGAADTESTMAQEIINEQFPRSLPNSTAIVVIQAADVTDEATKGFVMDLEDALLAEGVLEKVESFVSVYSVQRSILIELARALGPAVYALESQGLDHSTAIALIVAGAEGQVTAEFLESIYALGLAPDDATLEAFARQVVEAGSLETFPLPPDILREFVNEGEDTMLIIIAFSEAPRGFGSVEGDPILNNVLVIRDTVAELKALNASPDRAYVTGDAATTADAAISGAEDFQRIEPITIIVLIVLISLFFLSIVIPFVPLGSILVAFLIAQATVFLIGTFIAKVQDTTLTFLFTVMLGVGTDYAIFLIARYREERVEGRDRDGAVRTAVTWAGESIATSGATVIIAFGVLSFGSFALLRTMGIAIGLGVFIALLVSLTLVPAMLMLFGERVFWPTSGKRFSRYAERVRRKRAKKKSYFYRAAEMSVDHHKAVLGLAILISLPAMYIAFTAESSFDFIGGLTDAESIDGLVVLQEGFGAGRIGPTQIVVSFQEDIFSNGNLTVGSAEVLEGLSAAIAVLPNVQSTRGPTRPSGTPIDATDLSSLSPAELQAVLSSIGDDRRTVLLTIVFVEEPFTRTSMETVEAIREEIADLKVENPLLEDADVYVGGQTALTRDFADQTSSEFRTMQIIVVIAIFFVLLIVLGSYLLPVAAILSIGLSITWAYSATIIFFNEVLQAEVLFLVPLILFILLFG